MSGHPRCQKCLCELQKSEVVFAAVLQTFCLTLSESLTCGSLQECKCLAAVEITAGQVLKNKCQDLSVFSPMTYR